MIDMLKVGLSLLILLFLIGLSNGNCGRCQVCNPGYSCVNDTCALLRPKRPCGEPNPDGCPDGELCVREQAYPLHARCVAPTRFCGGGNSSSNVCDEGTEICYSDFCIRGERCGSTLRYVCLPPMVCQGNVCLYPIMSDEERRGKSSGESGVVGGRAVLGEDRRRHPRAEGWQ